MVPIGVLERQLKSKTEALLILSQELENVQMDKEALTLALQSLKKQIKHMGLDTSKLMEFAEENSTLKEKIYLYEKRIEDLELDNKTLRMQNFGMKGKKEVSTHNTACDHLDKMEKLLKKIQSLEQDVQALLDEKQELSDEKDHLRKSLHRLNHYLNQSMKRSPEEERIISVDGLVLENICLHDKIEQMAQDNQNLIKMYQKYKLTKEPKKKGKPAKDVNSFNGLFMSMSNVRDLMLDISKPLALPSSENTLSSSPYNEFEVMRDACRSLVDTLEDRCAALAQAKKLNKQLASRLLQLEDLLSGNCSENGIVTYPSKYLMKDYNSTNIEEEMAKIRLADICPEEGAWVTVISPENNPTELENPDLEEPFDDLPPDLKKLVEDAKSLLVSALPQ
ncbi:uncharacterized protein LOC136027546 [Artemia franciscana]|uniref:Coiled-coil domain-containing protein 149 n=1 Tax=Artemia franciscana TaxID=6661 RepID=A0AA88HEM0_ARTSF|nr:hypothetical protein QYM36_013565 [Artemia franciscana]